jgi:hypothetical protein
MGIRLKSAITTAIAAGALALLMSEAAQAQQPTPDQVSAIRSSCRSDFMANCSGVTPGGKDALECLKRNVSKLSGACQTAVSAINPPAAPAATAPATTAAPAAAPEPSTTPKPAAAPAAPKPAAKPSTAAATPATAKPSAAQTSAVRAACRSDFMAHCSGVTPGGAEALQCLQRNAAQLSGPCRSAVAAIGGGEAPATSGMATPPTAAAAPGFPPLGPVRPVLPRRAFMIVEICRADAQVLCPGIPPGGGRILSCLAENGPRLSPDCYKTLAPITQ